MEKRNICAGAFTLAVVILLLSVFTLAIDYEYRFLPGMAEFIIAVCNIVASMTLLVLTAFWKRMKDSATKRYMVFYATTITSSLIVLTKPQHYIVVSVAFAIIIAVNSYITAKLMIDGTFRDEYED